jgi:hypothetical protein
MFFLERGIKYKKKINKNNRREKWYNILTCWNDTNNSQENKNKKYENNIVNNNNSNGLINSRINESNLNDKILEINDEYS